MSDTSIALNRFGLGGRPGEAAPTDSRRWLLDQFGRFDPRPPAIAALPASRTIAADLAEYLREARTMRRERPRPETGAAPPPDRRARGYTPPAPEMREGGMAADPAMRPEMATPMQDGTASGQDRDPVAQARQFARRQGREFYVSMVGARANVALSTTTPFVERLVHFWANHFAVSADKLTVIGLAGHLEFEAVRPHVLGSFRDMLHAVERHPAMLLYLDQAQSVGPNSPALQFVARRRRGGGEQQRRLGLNENLAREILELHTLGVRTGYTQADVTEFARAMTGWTVAGLAQGPAARFTGTAGEPGRFVFAERLHEPGVRTILGRRWNDGGESQAAAVLDFLATHPATARHIATKLARHFAGDDPPAALVAKLEAAFLRSGGDLPTVYRALVDAPECWGARPTKFKSPWEWSLSALRALGTPEVQAQAVFGLMRQLGQPVWQPGSPAGWDDIAASWAGPDAIMRRVEAAERMAQRTRDRIDARSRAAELFPDALSRATAEQIARAESPSMGVALMLVAPEFLRR